MGTSRNQLLRMESLTPDLEDFDNSGGASSLSSSLIFFVFEIASGFSSLPISESRLINFYGCFLNRFHFAIRKFPSLKISVHSGLIDCLIEFRFLGFSVFAESKFSVID